MLLIAADRAGTGTKRMQEDGVLHCEGSHDLKP